MHCSNLISAIKEKTSSDQSIEFFGIGGEKMQAQGCKLIENPVGRSAMIHNAFKQVGYFFSLIKKTRNFFKENEIDLVIVCDSPAFNFHIAKAAKKQGIPVMFYVAPQLWAWAPWRIHKLKRCCDRLACILPFEKDWFGDRGVKVEFVGNPLFDGVIIDRATSCKTYPEYDSNSAVIALAPGSRKAEIETLYPAMQQIARKISVKHPNAKFLVPSPDQEKLALLKDFQDSGFECEYIVGNLPEAIERADLALVASGSATLQVAARGCPMVVMYQANRLLWHLIGKWLIKTRFFSLVNILAGRELAPEFMPYFTSTEPIYAKAEAMLSNKNKLITLSSDLVGLTEPLARSNASENTARIVFEMLDIKDNA